MTDLIRRADAIEALGEEPEIIFDTDAEWEMHDRWVDAMTSMKSLPSADAEQVTGKLKKPCDSLLTGDSDERKEHKSKLESAEAVDVAHDIPEYCRWSQTYTNMVQGAMSNASAETVQGWIPCSERLPKVNQRVLLATNDGLVFVGYREKPDLVWQVTEKDGRKHWVYDPENYTDDIEILPKNEDCGFSKDDVYSDGFLSVTSVNYDDRFRGVTAWMPLPKPYKGGDDK